MITFEKMNNKEFKSYIAFMLPDYAGDIAEHYLVSIEEANKDAETQIESLLPDQEDTEGHYFYHIKSDEKLAGYLWFHVKKEDEKAFLYHIYILEAYRNQGIASEALRFFEKEVKKHGAASLGLHVFGSNENAIKLYRKLGFKQASVSMNKII
ncbi:GNAT family N-acetyltransferase [Fictibacillus phosphorivorans]|uniref:GNAT family N-acetyltransferase n=1 Tax=Fictibacillus phosphorivorans TaxID=1221500 RepID=UPI002041E8DD|nr:GNAT family N-acetyltransferase [Fictibacillus phosphorivorans]MCM3719060.1 GNAT family N-acetyltransferase [Fictibacillus phosphorivorans]MCM3776682.1 GNAT family N-acetyltransferase [Fictibacillus phosphorivorans]